MPSWPPSALISAAIAGTPCGSRPSAPPFSGALRPAVRGDGDARWGLPASRLPRVVGGTSGVEY
eukprot:808300-Prymnesium_polylepis.1